MASVRLPLCRLSNSVSKPNKVQRHHLQVTMRFQSSRDEGSSANMVDANMKVLRERIEVTREKEEEEKKRLGRRMWCRRRDGDDNGWNYCTNNNEEEEEEEEEEGVGGGGGRRRRRYYYSEYVDGKNHNNKNNGSSIVSELTEIVGLATASLGLVFFTGSLCIFLVSFIVHLNL